MHDHILFTTVKHICMVEMNYEIDEIIPGGLDPCMSKRKDMLGVICNSYLYRSYILSCILIGMIIR